MAESPNIEEIWAKAVQSLVASGRMTGTDFGFAALVTPLALAADTVLLGVANSYTKDHLESPALREVLTEALSAVAERPVNFAITVDAAIAEGQTLAGGGPGGAAGAAGTAGGAPVADGQSQGPDSAGAESAARPAPWDDLRGQDQGEAVAAAAPHRPPPPESRLQARYTFESFVVGSSNRFAAAAARAVAETPANTYTPLFIFGGSGLGKTHLVHAIGNYALAMSPTMRVLYTTSEDFANDFISFLGRGKMDEFKRRYRGNDILLIDDIQFLIGKGQITEEFFHTFNSLYNSGSHIVITSDTPPKQLNGFEDRLRSRFEWGLLTDVLPPELETRIAILRQKSSAEGMDTPHEVQEYIASRISSNIRELEGALIRVTAFANLNRQRVDLTLAEVVLKDLVTDTDTEITPSLIIGQTAKYFDFTIEDICGPSRNRRLTEARHFAMYLCRELTDLSLPAIGREFGGRDHTTVMNAYRKVASMLSEKPSWFTRVTELTYRIKQSALERERT
ncbi:MAG: chromosomal replication initiator protein DnaA [Bifidobacteriaceae bacterium]|nr:chromosomal replication initiator protein DnaA [Bifidobacteriaceae bacterium]